jgi:predicted ATPase
VDGGFFLSLAALHDPPLVGPTVAQTLGIREVGGRPVLQDLKEHLREKQMLLVLDNFEQVLDAAPLLPELLATCARLKLLVTSRAVLHVYGEHEVPVAPLDVPTAADLPWPDRLGGCPSVLLFIERARALVPDFELSAENALPVADICLRLEGLPLAVELAAARAKLLPPRAMLPGLQSRLSLLTGGPRDVPARQQTLRATIAWSCSPLRSRRSSAGSRSSSVAGHLKRRRPSVESCPSWRARRC